MDTDMDTTEVPATGALYQPWIPAPFWVIARILWVAEVSPTPALAICLPEITNHTQHCPPLATQPAFANYLSVWGREKPGRWRGSLNPGLCVQSLPLSHILGPLLMLHLSNFPSTKSLHLPLAQ